MKRLLAGVGFIVVGLGAAWGLAAERAAPQKLLVVRIVCPSIDVAFAMPTGVPDQWNARPVGGVQAICQEARVVGETMLCQYGDDRYKQAGIGSLGTAQLTRDFPAERTCVADSSCTFTCR